VASALANGRAASGLKATAGSVCVGESQYSFFAVMPSYLLLC